MDDLTGSQSTHAERYCKSEFFRRVQFSDTCLATDEVKMVEIGHFRTVNVLESAGAVFENFSSYSNPLTWWSWSCPPCRQSSVSCEIPAGWMSHPKRGSGKSQNRHIFCTSPRASLGLPPWPFGRTSRSHISSPTDDGISWFGWHWPWHLNVDDNWDSPKVSKGPFFWSDTQVTRQNMQQNRSKL